MLVKNKKLPLSLVKDAFNKSTSKGERLLQIEKFEDTFGPLSRRKRPSVGTSSMAEMLIIVSSLLVAFAVCALVLNIVRAPSAAH